MIYFTLSELCAADWEQKVTTRAYITPEQYKQYKKDKVVPNSYWGGGSGVHVTAHGFDHMTKKDQEDVHGVQIEWVKTMKEMADDFYPVLEDLRKWSKNNKVGHGDIRLVFGFDN